MDKTSVPTNPADCSPTFSIAGVMPGSSNAAWDTAYPNPDTQDGPPRRSHGPTFSIAGAVPAGVQVAWPTSMPDPTRDTLDANGHVISKIEAAARSELDHGPGILTLPASSDHMHAA